MYSKVFKSASMAPAVAALPQLGAGVSGNVIAIAGMVMLVAVVGSTIFAKLRG